MSQLLPTTSILFVRVTCLVACCVIVATASFWVSSAAPGRKSAPDNSDAAAKKLIDLPNLDIARKVRPKAPLHLFSKPENNGTNGALSTGANFNSSLPQWDYLTSPVQLDSLLSQRFMVNLDPLLLLAGGVNVALASNGAVASASSTFSAGFPVSAGIDGDRKGLGWGNGGGWADANNGAFPDWLQINFSGSKTINEIDLFTVQDDRYNPVEPTETMTFTQFGITAFQVQYWNGASWVDVPGGNVTGNNKVWRKFTFPDLATGSIRVLVNGSTDGWSRITEVEAYQSGGTAPIYGGWLDTAACTWIGGWVWDSNQPNTPINVDVYDGALKILSNVPANLYRADLQAAGIGNGYHAFAIATPSSLKDSGSHSVSVKVAGTSSNLSNSPRSEERRVGKECRSRWSPYH